MSKVSAAETEAEKSMSRPGIEPGTSVFAAEQSTRMPQPQQEKGQETPEASRAKDLFVRIGSWVRSNLLGPVL